MTDSLVRKELFGQMMGKGFLPDSHCPTGAPRESFVKITRAEPGGIDGRGAWRPVTQGFRQGSESEAFRRYLAGGLVRNRT
jgi:nitrate reductase alpha subunit